MRVLNLRLGFATNSSSSHSIIILSTAKEAAGITGYPPFDGYGWENFTLTRKGEKRAYMVAQLAHALGYDSWEPERGQWPA